eukprot:3061_1
MNWNQMELKNFLQEKASHLENNISSKYDALIVIISCRCDESLQYIISSDNKLFSKLAFHRTFTLAHRKCRKIPKLFLYDFHGTYDTYSSSEIVEESDIADAKYVNAPWVDKEKNPDHMLAIVELITERTETESIMLNDFYQKMMINLTENKRR